MKPLHILHTEAAIAFGGQERRILKELQAMRLRGHHMELLCRPHAQMGKYARDAGFAVHVVQMGGLINYLKGVFSTWRLLRRGHFDVVNTHSRIDTLLAGTAARLARTPLIVRTRHLANRPGSLLSYTWLPHRVTTVSEHVRQTLIDKGVRADHVTTIYSPVPLPQPVEHSSLREELGLDEHAVIVGCVAVMRAMKGHIDLINAMAPLMKDRPWLHMVFVGDGSPTFSQVKAHIQSLGLEKKIHLLGTRQDIPNLLAGFDLFALATRKEASGTVFVEAQAAGLPVIGTDVGGVGEMMRNGQSGILVPLDDAQALTEALRRLIDDPELRRKMGMAGLAFCRQSDTFSTERLAENTEACYMQWLTERQCDTACRRS